MKRKTTNFVCADCGKEFKPTANIEYTITNDELRLTCPACIRVERELWTLTDIKFGFVGGMGLHSYYCVSFNRGDGSRIEDQPYFSLNDRRISIRSDKFGSVGKNTQIPEDWISEQLVAAFDKQRAETAKWKAQVRFIESFDESVVDVVSEAYTGKIKFKTNRSAKLELDPNVKIDKRIIDQIESAWKKYLAA